MTTRKPDSVSFPGWVEHQIRSAQQDGAFDNLTGAGKPIPDLDRTPHELAWVAGYLRRENVDIVGVLPPTLALAKEVEDLPGRLLAEPTESAARRVVDKLNARIDKAHAAPQTGPPLRVRRVDVEAAIDRWRAARADPEPPPAAPAPIPVRRSRWWRRST